MNHHKKPLVIFGSSRSDGHTRKAVDLVLDGRKTDVVDLLDLTISPYDYENRNANDDFIPLAEKMIDHDPLILATPVYWYTMSATMKMFIDRWSDLLTIRKDLGRALAGKRLFVVTSYSGEYTPAFEEIFKLTCQYMNMHFAGCYYFYSGDNPAMINQNAPQAELFKQLLWNKVA